MLRFLERRDKANVANYCFQTFPRSICKARKFVWIPTQCLGRVFNHSHGQFVKSGNLFGYRHIVLAASWSPTFIISCFETAIQTWCRLISFSFKGCKQVISLTHICLALEVLADSRIAFSVQNSSR